MTTKKRNIIKKITAIILIVITAILFIGKDHFLLGSIFYFARWILLILFIILLLLNLRNNNYMKYVWGFLVLIFIGSGLINKLQSQRLDSINNPDQAKELSIMTYNLFFRNNSPLSSIQIIKKQNPDILLVQELTPQWESIIKSNLNYKYKSTKALRGTHGIGIYSRYPISEVSYLNNKRRLPYAQILKVKFNDKNILICNSHLASPAIAVENTENFFAYYGDNYNIRKEQYIEINKTMSRDKDSEMILIGDLNSLKSEPLFSQIKKDWVDLHGESGKGFGFNFPNSSRFKKPFLTLDYILLKGEIDGISCKVIEGGSSDHLAIIGKIKI